MSYLSDTFKYISYFRHAGHQVGRKVGVEQTVNGKFKKTFKKVGNTKSYLVPYDTEFQISFAPRGQVRHTYNLIFRDNRTVLITKVQDEEFNFEAGIANDHRIIFTLGKDFTSEVIGNNNSLRDYNKTLRNCRILEIISVNDDGVTALLNDCLSGPQTPEKAKQSSFVALDVRKKRFNSFDKREPENEMVSVLVITEFAHWENKSQNMIKACIDKNFVVEDNLNP